MAALGAASLALLFASGCEGVLGIEDPVLVEADAGGDPPDASGSGGEGADAGGATDAGERGSLSFERVAFDAVVHAVDVASPESSGAAGAALSAERLSIAYDLGDTSSVETAPIAEGAEDVWIGDLAGDSTSEIAVSTPTPTVYLHRFTGEAYEQTTLSAEVEGNSSVTGADVTLDGITDLVFASEQRITVLRQFDDGTFEESPQVAVAATKAAMFRDVTGDGLPDVALLGGPAEETQLFVVPHVGSAERELLYPEIITSVGATGSDLAAAARSPGGLPDIVVAAEANAPSVYPNQGEGRFGAPRAIDLELRAPVASGDLNGDGLDDLVGLDSDGRLVTFRGDGVSWQRGTTLEGAGDARDIAVAEIDGDGRPDIVVASQDGLFVYTQIDPS